MVSATQQTERIRIRKARRAGTRRKRFERAHGTPVFAVHPEGYDAKAADARPIAAAPAAAAPSAPKKTRLGAEPKKK
jgi:hypothetical protein